MTSVALAERPTSPVSPDPFGPLHALLVDRGLMVPDVPRFSLREIADGSLLVDAMLEASAGDVTPEIEALMEQLGALLLSKPDGIVSYIQALTREADALKDEEVRLKALRVRLDDRITRYETYVLTHMQRMDRLKLEGRYHKLACVTNPPKLIIKAPDEIPADFVTVRTVVERIVDNAKLKAYLVAREKQLATIPEGAPLPEDLPPDVPAAELTRGTRLKID